MNLQEDNTSGKRKDITALSICSKFILVPSQKRQLLKPLNIPNSGTNDSWN